ncbi:hypothetical protein PN462_09075 [Spirulina sp. CS-785/01]|uniref:hypothetical protein n=1 Tax=Spirulina sp. CS-785/01 TaxID=3021716 RepID=UPI002330D6DC|nr:hypothetical protein [Spirulina sp. CS-785/01]MDB9313249.1 hypothetical protein [Spirulina sp. CS-785/01]
MEQNYHNILLVRASENQNNNYFKLLKQSDVWEAYCGEEAYDKIGGYTGFDLKNWITQNINWHTDLLPETVEHLTNSNLLKYLEW